jgi:hypothetical protein
VNIVIPWSRPNSLSRTIEIGYAIGYSTNITNFTNGDKTDAICS